MPATAVTTAADDHDNGVKIEEGFHLSRISVDVSGGFGLLRRLWTSQEALDFSGGFGSRTNC